MKIAHINTFSLGSTGKIALGLCENLVNVGHKPIIFCPTTKTNKKNCSRFIELYGFPAFRFFSFLVNTCFGLDCTLNFISTLALLHKIKKYKPDFIHLHNIHGSIININLLFRYIKKNNVRIIWTFHDCWPFTGRCPYFQITGCNRWKTGCGNCIYPKDMYPAANIDRTEKMWKLKKKWFTGVKDLTVVTLSKWFAGLVKESFLKDNPIKVINNGIDLNIFKPTPSDFREKIRGGCKYILLGVAFDWGHRKGLDVFIELSKRLDADYQIVLVGTNNEVDKLIPKNIVSIHKTNNQQELAEIYSSADLFVNPTREENYPTVNMEALACGCPVITFNTGGSPEIIDDKSGCVVRWDDIDEMEKQIIDICENHRYKREDCVERAKSFDMNERFNEYIELYKEISKENE